MTKPQPRCLHCGGQVWAGRCRSCRRWAKVCEECGTPFASVRRDARHCHRPCAIKAWRRKHPARKSPQDRDIHLEVAVTMRQGKDRPVQLTQLSITVPREAK